MRVATDIDLKDNLPSAAAPAAASWWFLGSPTPKKILYEALRRRHPGDACRTHVAKDSAVRFFRVRHSRLTATPTKVPSQPGHFTLACPVKTFFSPGCGGCVRGVRGVRSTCACPPLPRRCRPAQQNPLSQLTLSSCSFACFLTLGACEVDSRLRWEIRGTLETHTHTSTLTRVTNGLDEKVEEGQIWEKWAENEIQTSAGSEATLWHLLRGAALHSPATFSLGNLGLWRKKPSSARREGMKSQHNPSRLGQIC